MVGGPGDGGGGHGEGEKLGLDAYLGDRLFSVWGTKVEDALGIKFPAFWRIQVSSEHFWR